MKYYFFTFCAFIFCIHDCTANSSAQLSKLDWEVCELGIFYKKNRLTLSEAIRELAYGITDPFFGEEIYHRIEEFEKKDGNAEYKEWWSNGQMKIQGQLKNHFAEGHIHGWYEDGTDAFKGFFSEGLKKGVHITFYPLAPKRTTNAMARILVFNKLGHLAGYQKSCYRSGRLRAAIKFRDGILDGKTELYEENYEGTCQEFYYKKGKLLKTKIRFPDVD